MNRFAGEHKKLTSKPFAVDVDIDIDFKARGRPSKKKSIYDPKSSPHISPK